MAKLAVRLLTFALVLFIANASITTVTVDNEDNPWGRKGESCQQQIEKQHYLRQCQQYMESQSSNDKHLDACCAQLEELDRQCRCPALEQAMQRQMQTRGEMGWEEMQMTEKILSKCKMEPRRCTGMKTHDNRSGRTSCEEQIEEQSNLKHCQRYMEECQSGSSSSMYAGRRGGGNDKILNACCSELEELDRQCRCPGLKRAVEQQMRGEQMGSKEEQEMYQMAEKIMSKCEMEPRRCRMSPRAWM